MFQLIPSDIDSLRFRASVENFFQFVRLLILDINLNNERVLPPPNPRMKLIKPASLFW